MVSEWVAIHWLAGCTLSVCIVYMILGVCIRNCDCVQGRVGALGYCVAIVTLTGTERLISPILVRYSHFSWQWQACSLFSFVSSSLISCANFRQTDLKWCDSSSGGKPSGSVFVSTATKLQPSSLHWSQPHMYTGTVLTRFVMSFVTV